VDVSPSSEVARAAVGLRFNAVGVAASDSLHGRAETETRESVGVSLEARSRGLLNLRGTLGIVTLTNGLLCPASVAVDHEAQKDDRHRALVRFGLVARDLGLRL
jgi:hypothetical protein